MAPDEIMEGTMVTTVHRGPCEEIAPTHHAVTGWTAEHSREMAGPPGEIHLDDPQTVPELLSRICSRSGPRRAVETRLAELSR